MDKKRTELVFVIDKSGSMSGLEADTIGGFNSMLNKIKAEGDPCRLTAVMFNNESDVIYDRIDIEAVPELTDKDYEPGGSTALVDATVEAVKKIIKVQKNSSENYRAENVIFVIITDGEENSSREYTADYLKKLIREEEEKYGWEFVFLGANIDAVKTADMYGIRESHSANYMADKAGTRLAYGAMANFVTKRTRMKEPVEAELSAELDVIRADHKKRRK